MFRYLLSAAVAFLSFSAPALALDCTPATDAIDPRCYGAAADGQNDDGPALQQAIDAAISQEKPLHLIHAHFATYEPLNIDYGAGPANGHEGFEIQSDGATIDGTPAGNVIVLTINCFGGNSGAPKGRDGCRAGAGVHLVVSTRRGPHAWKRQGRLDGPLCRIEVFEPWVAVSIASICPDAISSCKVRRTTEPRAAHSR
jgi:hypothetical protein